MKNLPGVLSTHLTHVVQREMQLSASLLLLIGVMILCVALLPLLIKALSNRFSHKKATSEVKLIDHDMALALLQRRHARGQIDAVSVARMQERLEAWTRHQQSSQDQPQRRIRYAFLLAREKTFLSLLAREKTFLEK